MVGIGVDTKAVQKEKNRVDYSVKNSVENLDDCWESKVVE
jgi:hypothetical protein